MRRKGEFYDARGFGEQEKGIKIPGFSHKSIKFNMKAHSEITLTALEARVEASVSEDAIQIKFRKAYLCIAEAVPHWF